MAAIYKSKLLLFSLTLKFSVPQRCKEYSWDENNKTKKHENQEIYFNQPIVVVCFPDHSQLTTTGNVILCLSLTLFCYLCFLLDRCKIFLGCSTIWRELIQTYYFVPFFNLCSLSLSHFRRIQVIRCLGLTFNANF